MANINNIFIESKNKQTYNDYKSDINPNSLVFLKKEKRIIGNDSEYQFVTEHMSELIELVKKFDTEIYEHLELNAGDIILAHNETEELTVCNSDRLDHYKNTHKPIGIVVIPSSHDVYGTGEAAIMSLKHMSKKTPDSGSIDSESMYLYSNTNIPILDIVPCMSDSDGNIANTIQRTSSDGTLPYDIFSNISCPHDSNSFYYSNGTCLPSTYLTDGSRNPNYYFTGIIPSVEEVRGEPVPYTNEFNIRWETLSGEWTESEKEDAFDGKQFVSVSPGANGSTVIRCTFSGVKGLITFNCISDGLSSYDYLTIGELDTPCTRTSYGTSLSGKAKQAMLLTFETPDEEEHFVEFCYSKNATTDTAPDCATIFIMNGEYTPILVPATPTIDCTKNALSDFNGLENTKILCNSETSQPNWKIDETITTTKNAAACCCWRYDTIGIRLGSWYLPSLGELGYMFIRRNTIDTSILLINEVYSDEELCRIRSYDYYLSSSTYNTSKNWTIYTNGNSVRNNLSGYVIAFTRVKIERPNFYTRKEIDDEIDTTLELINTNSDNIDSINNTLSEVKDNVEEIDGDFYEIITLNAGDIVLADNETDLLTYCTPDDLSLYKETHTPVGIVTIPNNHDIYGTGEAAIISLKPMNYDTPDTGGTVELGMYWGDRYTDTIIPNLNVVEGLGTMDGEVYDTIQCYKPYGHIPTDVDTGKDCPHDKGLKYNNSNSSAWVYIPSPYLTGGSRNPLYYDTSLTELNSMSDFDGLNNTKILCDLATAQWDWKTSDTITNSVDYNYYPAACCCWRYNPKGIGQGNWYLPACGELGYAAARFKVINNSFNIINNVYTGKGLAVPFKLQAGTQFYWASTETDKSGAKYIRPYEGRVDAFDKRSSYFVRAFARVKFKRPLRFYTKEEIDDKLNNISLNSIEPKLNQIEVEKLYTSDNLDVSEFATTTDIESLQAENTLLKSDIEELKGLIADLYKLVTS